MEKLLEVRDLHVSFNSRNKTTYAVAGASFTLFPNETIGIVGESGSGKSSMARALLKLSNHSTTMSGEILYQEKNILHLSEKEMRKIRGREIAMIFQDPTTYLNPTMKVGLQILEMIRLHDKKIGHEKAYLRTLDLMNEVGISDSTWRFEQYPHELSGGMKQRIMIAIALASHPKIIVADEATTALDVTVQAQILELLKKIQKERGMSILFITHDLRLVANVCDRVLVMYGGQIVEQGSVETLFSHPKHPYTSALLELIPRIDGTHSELKPIAGNPPDLREKLLGCRFCSRCKVAMTICEKENPPTFSLENNHGVACFKHHPLAKGNV